MAFDAFRQYYGEPFAGTDVPLATLGLEHVRFLVDFVQDVGAGVFRDGMFSVVSQRERVSEIGPWGALVPPRSRHFATSGLADLFFVTPDETIAWIETQYGHAFELAVRPSEFFDWIAGEDPRRRYLAQELWDERCAILEPDEVLAFAPALALGGPVDWGNLERVRVREHLALLAQIVLA